MDYDERDKTIKDGLLHGLIQSAGPYRPHLLQKISSGTGAAASGKQPGKQRVLKFSAASRGSLCNGILITVTNLRLLQQNLHFVIAWLA